MSDNTNAMRHLTNVGTREVEAMHADVLGYPAHLGYAMPIDGEYLAGLLTIIRTLTNDEHVREPAGSIVATLVPGASSGMHAARAAVRIARRAVDASKAHRAEDFYGDLT